MNNGYKIAICNYSFEVTNDKRIKLIIDLKLAPLVGDTVEEIKEDPTGSNLRNMRRNYRRKQKITGNIDNYSFSLKTIDIIRFKGKTMQQRIDK